MPLISTIHKTFISHVPVYYLDTARHAFLERPPRESPKRPPYSSTQNPGLPSARSGLMNCVRTHLFAPKTTMTANEFINNLPLPRAQKGKKVLARFNWRGGKLLPKHALNSNKSSVWRGTLLRWPQHSRTSRVEGFLVLLNLRPGVTKTILRFWPNAAWDSGG